MPLGSVANKYRCCDVVAFWEPLGLSSVVCRGVATIFGPPANNLLGPLAKGLRRLLLPGGPLQPRGPPAVAGPLLCHWLSAIFRPYFPSLYYGLGGSGLHIWLTVAGSTPASACNIIYNARREKLIGSCYIGCCKDVVSQQWLNLNYEIQ